MAIKLYWAPRSRSLRALWLFEEAGCPYERILVDINKGDQNKPEYRAINPMMKVPAIADGDAKMAESAAICAYIAEKFPEANLAPKPGDPHRMRYLHWLFFAPANIEPAYTQKMTKLQMPTRSAGWGDYERVMSVLEHAALAPGPWVLGNAFSAADIMIGTDLYFGVRLFKIVEPKPVFEEYISRCAARPAFQRALAIENAGI